MAANDNLARQLSEIMRQRREQQEQLQPPPPLLSGGGGGTSGPMEERVTRLETHMEYVQRDLASIDGKLDQVNDRLMQLATKSELRTWQWQWIATGVAIIALTVGGITGGLALIASYAG